MAASVVAKVSRLGVLALGAAVALAAMNGPSVAQNAKPAASPAAAGAKAAGGDAAKMAKGKELFGNNGCGACHTLADAGATGNVGPKLDGDTNLSESFVTDRVTNGQGAMPAFGGQMSADDISAIAYYVTHAAAKS